MIHHRSSNTIFSYQPYYNTGPYVLAASGTFTLKLTNTNASSSGTYDFNMLDLLTSATAPTLAWSRARRSTPEP